MTVQTVLGPEPADQLGVTLPHEHVICDFVGAAQTDPARWDGDTVVTAVEPNLRELVQRGVRTFVDCTPELPQRTAPPARNIPLLALPRRRSCGHY